MGDLIAAVAPVNADLDELGTLAQREERAGTHAAVNAIEHFIRAGEALLQLKERAPHGRWLPLLRKHDFSADRAERYMRLARHAALVRANSARVRNLSVTAALRLIDPQTKPATEAAKPTRKTKKTVTKPVLSTLAWSEATLEERRHFLNGINLKEVREAMPPAWIPELENLAWSEATLEQRKRFLAGIPLRELREAMPPAWILQLENLVLGNVAMRAPLKAQEAIRKLRRKAPPVLELEATLVA